MNWKSNYHIYAFTTIFFWSLAYVYTRLAIEYFSAFSLGFLRYAIASVVLLCVAFVMKIEPPSKEDLLLFIGSGATGFFLYMLTFNKGSETVTAAAGSLIIATVPIITAFMARFLFQEKLNPLQWFSIALEFSGILVLTFAGGIFSFNIGNLWLLLAAFCLTSYNLFQRRLTRKYSALQTSIYSIFGGTLMLAIFLPQSIGEAVAAPPIQWLYLFILGIFSSAIAYVSWSKAFACADRTSSVSNYMFFTPLLTAVLGFLIAGEVPDLETVAGGAIILGGAVLFNKAKYTTLSD